MQCIWTEYMRYRASFRRFDLAQIESVVRYSNERYLDRVTGRHVAIGRHDDALIMVPYDTVDGDIIPVTVHATTRAQVNARLKSGRFAYE